jgi:hypothetical protein
MATKTLPKTNQPKLNIQHDYITLKLPTGNYTTSYRGAKVSGQLCNMKGAFEALDGYVEKTRKTKTVGDAMNDLLDKTLLDKLVPGWDKPVIADTFANGDVVSFMDGFFSKKYPSTYTVDSAKGKYVYIGLPNKMGIIQVIGVIATDLKKV